MSWERVYPKADTLNRRLVAGERIATTILEFQEKCAVRIEREQRETNPETALIALLCEAIRLGREHTELLGSCE